jgi:hydrogenase maturation protease
MGRILVYGYGNPGRQDDGLGPALVAKLEEERVPGVTTDCNYQLQIEDAVAVAEHDAVIFVDASLVGGEPFTFTELEPSNDITFTTHTMSPASVLALCHELYRKSVRAYLLAIRGYEWELVEGLSPMAAKNLDEASRFIASTIPDVMDMVERDRVTEGSLTCH